MIKTILLLFFTSLYILGNSQMNIPPGYGELTNSPSSGKEMKTISFFMDDDSIQDYATIIQKIDEFSTYKLLVYLSSQKEQYIIPLLNNSEFSIYPEQLNVKKNVLCFGYYSDGTSAYGHFFKLRYNKSAKKIQLIGYDSGYRLPNGHVDKSYNLLTGKYIVNSRLYMYRTRQEKVEENTGKDSVRMIYIDDINDSLLEQLDDIGDEYPEK